MDKVVADYHKTFRSISKWSQVGNLLSLSLLSVLVSGMFCAASLRAQDPNQGDGQLSSSQSEGQLPSYQTNLPAGQKDQSADQQTDGTVDQKAMSADEINNILRQQPDILASIKSLAAQQAGVDPTTISDAMIYDQIQRDPSLRDLATKELIRRGYSVNPEAENKESQNPANSDSARRAVPLTSGPSSNQSRPSTSLDTQTRPYGQARPYEQNRSYEQNRPYGQTRPYEDPDHPQVQHQLEPYRNIPSMRDLYSQFPLAEKKLRRFGSETFVLGTGNANQLPIDVPVGPDYVLGPGDSLVVNIWGGQSSRLERPVDRQGQIELPEVGTIKIAGLTIAQAQIAIQKSLSTQFQNEQVEISLGRVRTVRVYVVGDVQRPGAYDVSSLSTPLNALYAAGGPTDTGSLRTLRHLRGTQLISEIDLYEFLLKGVRSEADRLQPGDTLLVPPVGAQVSVSGMVHRPAIYELKGEQGLDQVLELAGGVLASANLKQIRVERIEAHQSRTMLSLQIPDDKKSITKDMTNFKIRDGDSVHVSQILPYNEQMVYLDGHVFRPGKYPYQEGMVLSDLLHSYIDVMPEPADHAELIRLQPPDFRPETIGFNLPDVLNGNDSIKLQPFDLVRIFSRYEIDSPKVSIEGEVLRPGEFPMSEGMTVSALLRMAGGFKRSAYRDEVGLSSYVVQDGRKVLLEHSIVSVEKALHGDKSADVVLKPGDVVGVWQLTGWQDIGSSVIVSGEVEHVGSYGIQPGERLSSVLKRAGGLRESAYPEGAVLERVQIRVMGERARQDMIGRLETTPLDVKPGLLTGPEQAEQQKAIQLQREQTLAALRSHPASGRMLINISTNINEWENTIADIELRAGDTLLIPKQQRFVLVNGQVYNATGISYVPRRTAAWYLRQAGGATRSGDKGATYVIRANGSVIGRGSSWMGGNVLNISMRPGDTIVVPEKGVGSQVFKNVLAAAQIMSSVAITGAVAGIF